MQREEHNNARNSPVQTHENDFYANVDDVCLIWTLSASTRSRNETFGTKFEFQVGILQPMCLALIFARVAIQTSTGRAVVASVSCWEL